MWKWQKWQVGYAAAVIGLFSLQFALPSILNWANRASLPKVPPLGQGVWQEAKVAQETRDAERQELKRLESTTRISCTTNYSQEDERSACLAFLRRLNSDAELARTLAALDARGVMVIARPAGSWHFSGKNITGFVGSKRDVIFLSMDSDPAAIREFLKHPIYAES